MQGGSHKLLVTACVLTPSLIGCSGATGFAPNGSPRQTELFEHHLYFSRYTATPTTSNIQHRKREVGHAWGDGTPLDPTPSYRAQEPGHRPEAWVETVEELFSSVPQLELESRGASPLSGAPRPSLTQDHTHCRLESAGKRCYGPQRLSGGRGTGRSDAAPHEPQPRRGWEHWHNRSSKGGTRRCVHDCRLLRSC